MEQQTVTAGHRGPGIGRSQQDRRDSTFNGVDLTVVMFGVELVDAYDEINSVTLRHLVFTHAWVRRSIGDLDALQSRAGEQSPQVSTCR